jgi:hypothetical protein
MRRGLVAWELPQGFFQPAFFAKKLTLAEEERSQGRA